MEPQAQHSFPIKPVLVVLAAIVLAGLVLMHQDPLNGPSYWRWAWRQPRLAAATVYIPLLLCAAPVLAVQGMKRRNRLMQGVAIFALALSSFGMRLSAAALRTNPPSLKFVEAVVRQPQMTSYYTDAASVKDRPLRQWVAEYPRLMGGFNLHTQSKPPGPMLYWWTMIQIFGEPSAARVGGIILGLLAVVGIPATYLLLRLMLGDEPAAFCGASFLALSPGFVLFFPMMDPAYIVLSCGMIGLWVVALRNGQSAAAAGLGVWLGITLTISFSLLALGTFMLMLIGLVPTNRDVAERMKVAGRQALIAGAATVGACLLLWIIIGYDPVATFLSAWHHQHDLLARYADQRPYPWTILFDLTDFALGSGWIGFLIALCSLTSPPRHRLHTWIILAATGQLLIVAITGLLQSETSRVWNFMLPLLMIPVGLELARWPLPWRVGCLAALALLTAVIHQNMGFLY